MINSDAAIVGAGVQTSIGNSVSETWANTLEGTSGLVVASDNETLVAPINDVGSKNKLYIVARNALNECICEAGWEHFDERTALVFANGSPDTDTILTAINQFDTKGRCRPDTVYRSMYSYITARLSKEFSIRGPVYSVSAACAGSSHAINLALLLLESGTVDRCLVGGGEIITDYTQQAFSGMRTVLSTMPNIEKHAIQPFGANRTGMALGEGCGWIALDKNGSSKIRDSIKITESHVCNVPDAVYGDVVDQNDWDKLLKTPSKSDCDLVFAHATSTPTGDLAEGEALIRNFKQAQVRSTKYMFGHTLSASTVLDIIMMREVMLSQIIIPFGHDYEIDPLLGDLKTIEDKNRAPIKKAIKISAAFGGALGMQTLEATAA